MALLAFASVGFLAGCGTEAEDPIAELPAATGTVNISFLNFPGTGDVMTTAAAGDVIAVAVEVTKSAGGNRPQKLRVYETTTKNTRGTQVGSDYDLRNTDEAQIKNINYPVPSSGNTVYLYFEVDESASAFSRKLLTINVNGTAGVSAFSGIRLGAQGVGTGPSRLASATGQIYSACNAAANMSDIDITYAFLNGTTPTILSNPERAVQGLGTTATNCDETTNSSTAGGPNTLFIKAPSTESFDNASDATLAALSFTNARALTSVAVGDVIAFKTTGNRNGLIRVESITTGTTGSIGVSVKVQR
ncbi:MAG: hypothetical protein AVDCRST_MAG56-7564 [uncultured Cytophagales bacterium]|uniref:Uncharacterized protein n=1 Tax=uncultured Cytophagales bacterium TaxID=158755 RepID=A0A6J4LLP3_9SPHI|nr:MAG: hypothetical protein AVDCRST_MAG56-7564 [uncultured Cytophagales bacterium]